MTGFWHVLIKQTQSNLILLIRDKYIFVLPDTAHELNFSTLSLKTNIVHFCKHVKVKKKNQHLGNVFCDLGISRGRFFDCYFGSQKLDLYSEKYGTCIWTDSAFLVSKSFFFLGGRG